MHPDPSEHNHETLSDIVSASFAMFSEHLKEAYRRRFELPSEEQIELAMLVKAHDQFVNTVAAHRAMRYTGFNINTPTQGSA